MALALELVHKEWHSFNDEAALARARDVISYKLPVITSERKGKLLNWETFFNEHRVEHDSAEIKNLFLSYLAVIIMEQEIVQFQQLVALRGLVQCD
jgi:hypothetical protein